MITDMTRTIMDRRTFIRLTAFGFSSAAALSLLTACGAGAAIEPVAEPAMAAVGGKILHTVAGYLADFASSVGASVIANRADQWLQGLTHPNKAKIDSINTGMWNGGFRDFGNPVFSCRAAMFYGVGNLDGYNTCSLLGSCASWGRQVA